MTIQFLGGRSSHLFQGNIGNAKTTGLATDLGLSDDQWLWVLYAFYIAYILFEWTTILWKVLPAHKLIAAICVWYDLLPWNSIHYVLTLSIFSWGVSAMCSGAVKSFTQLIVCRSLLGIFEAIFGCGAPYFLSLFYKRRELGFRLALLLGMAPIANCFASALAYGITRIEGTLEPWRYLFIIGNCCATSEIPQ